MIKPVSPVIPGKEIPELRIAEDQPEYGTLPAIRFQNDEGSAPILTRWQLDDEDIERIRETKSIYLWIMTFGNPIQPLFMQTDIPDIPAPETAGEDARIKSEAPE